MAIRRPPTTFSDTISTADIADDAITGGKLANDIAISTTGNIVTTGSGALTVAGTSNFGSVASGTIGSAVTGFTGVKEFDTWQLASNFTINPSGEVLDGTGTWIRSAAEHLGGGLTYDDSTGAFTLPQTGKYLIILMGYIGSGAISSYGGLNIQITTDNWTSSTIRAESYTRTETDGHHHTVSCQCVLDCANTSTHKFRIKSTANSTGHSWHGSSSSVKTGVTTIRLSDT